MSNYVWNKVICRRDVLEQYFIDPDPFGDGQLVDPPYISFNRLFGVKSLKEYSESYGIYISYGNDFLWEERPDGLVDIKFTTRWQYPIRAILKVLELTHDTVWCAVEENHSYASKFLWQDGPKEFICALGDAYFDWDDAHPEFLQSLPDADDSAWYFLQEAEPAWQSWPSEDQFKRYLDVAAVHVQVPLY